MARCRPQQTPGWAEGGVGLSISGLATTDAFCMVDFALAEGATMQPTPLCFVVGVGLEDREGRGMRWSRRVSGWLHSRDGYVDVQSDNAAAFTGSSHH